jgi:hypothetical protein
MPDTSTEVAIATTTLGSSTSTITLSSIPNTYTDLRVVFANIRTTPGTGTIVLRFNGDTANNYSRTNINGDGASATSAQFSTVSWIHTNGGNTSTTVPGMLTLDIFSYAGSTNKTVLATASFDQNGSGNVTRTVGLYGAQLQLLLLFQFS